MGHLIKNETGLYYLGEKNKYYLVDFGDFYCGIKLYGIGSNNLLISIEKLNKKLYNRIKEYNLSISDLAVIIDEFIDKNNIKGTKKIKEFGERYFEKLGFLDRDYLLEIGAENYALYFVKYNNYLIGSVNGKPIYAPTGLRFRLVYMDDSKIKIGETGKNIIIAILESIFNAYEFNKNENRILKNEHVSENTTNSKEPNENEENLVKLTEITFSDKESKTILYYNPDKNEIVIKGTIDRANDSEHEIEKYYLRKGYLSFIVTLGFAFISNRFDRLELMKRAGLLTKYALELHLGVSTLINPHNYRPDIVKKFYNEPDIELQIPKVFVYIIFQYIKFHMRTHLDENTSRVLLHLLHKILDERDKTKLNNLVGEFLFKILRINDTTDAKKVKELQERLVKHGYVKFQPNIPLS